VKALRQAEESNRSLSLATNEQETAIHAEKLSGDSPMITV
jgi:hypothetical protein